jgi:hypothetical protein
METMVGTQSVFSALTGPSDADRLFSKINLTVFKGPVSVFPNLNLKTKTLNLF